jgi:hypothetical protein
MSSEGIWAIFPQIEIAEQGDLGPVVDDLHVDVQDELGYWRVCELRWVRKRLEGGRDLLRPGCALSLTHASCPSSSWRNAPSAVPEQVKAE